MTDYLLQPQVWAAHSKRSDSCIPARCQEHNAGCDLETELRSARHHCVLVGGHTRNFIRVLQRSVFCAVLPGNGWAHIEEPVIQGCIPVIIMPGIHVQLEDVLDVSRFSVRVQRNDIPRLIDILSKIPEQKVREMQSELHKVCVPAQVSHAAASGPQFCPSCQVWERYTYSGLYKREFAMQKQARTQLARLRVGVPTTSGTSAFAPVEARLSGADAVDALMQLLRLRMESRESGKEGMEPLLVDHGQEPPQLEPIPGYTVPDTRGVQ